MDSERGIDDLNRHLSLQLRGLLPPGRCREMIARYDAARASGQLHTLSNELIDECRERVFTDGLNTLLRRYFGGGFEACWPSVDVAGSAGFPHNLNAAWHLDSGIRGMHKLLIYLNPVAEHGGNTVMLDQAHTKSLLRADVLPVEQDRRREDLSPVFADLGISPALRAYDLGAGDGLLFDPLNLAHRCQPTMAGKRRYTICFSIVPTRVPGFCSDGNRC